MWTNYFSVSVEHLSKTLLTLVKIMFDVYIVIVCSLARYITPINGPVETTVFPIIFLEKGYGVRAQLLKRVRTQIIWGVFTKKCSLLSRIGINKISSQGRNRGGEKSTERIVCLLES